MKYTGKELEELGLIERVMIINEMLDGSSLKKLLSNDVMVSKGKLKQLLKPYEYNADTKRFELSEVTEMSGDKSDNELRSESQENGVFELLCNIETLMQTSVNYQREHNELMLRLLADKVTIVESEEFKLYKTLTNDKLITRSFKIYESINERLKRATKNSAMNQQQLFNAIFDKGLRELGH